MDHTICHFEIPADDPEALAQFYRELFGWDIGRWEGPMEYWYIKAAPEGQGVNGGMMRRQHPQQGIMNYIAVESVEEYAKKAESLGAQILMPKTAVGDMGWFAVLLDPQHNCIAIWETKQ